MMRQGSEEERGDKKGEKRVERNDVKREWGKKKEKEDCERERERKGRMMGAWKEELS